ncbi:MAG: hypothetical protein ACRDDY_13440 [Clostridium sp.]|uniref:hypothetical protein n=1 Tax=Clostridium sp. TaxID=1506 RepID=UPI003EE4CB4A
MSMPNIPDINPKINLDIEDSIKVLLNSIAMEELGLSHIINAEGEKLQYVLKSLEEKAKKCYECSICSSYKKGVLEDLDYILKVNESINNTMKTIFRSQTFLQMKLENVIEMKKIILENEKKDIEHTNECNCNEKMYEHRWKDCETKREIGVELLDENVEVSCSPVFLKAQNR